MRELRLSPVFSCSTKTRFRPTMDFQYPRSSRHRAVLSLDDFAGMGLAQYEFNPGQRETEIVSPRMKEVHTVSSGSCIRCGEWRHLEISFFGHSIDQEMMQLCFTIQMPSQWTPHHYLAALLIDASKIKSFVAKPICHGVDESGKEPNLVSFNDVEKYYTKKGCRVLLESTLHFQVAVQGGDSIH